jgi:hypothetical protein
MSVNNISICSDALIKIGANPIASFEDGTVEAEAALNIYNNVKRSLLSEHPWNFATKKAELGRLDKELASDYEYAYLLPSDCIRIISAGSEIRSRGMEYKIVGEELHSDYEEVVISYISDLDESFFPPYFIAALTYKLAMELTIPLTESTNRATYFATIADDMLRKAKLVDAQEETTDAIDDYTLINARY